MFIGKTCFCLNMVLFMHVTALRLFHIVILFPLFFSYHNLSVLKHLCKTAIQKTLLGGLVRSKSKLEEPVVSFFFFSILQDDNKANTRTTSKGLWATLKTLLRSTKHCPVLVLQLPPPKQPVEELLPSLLLCSTLCLILNLNSASLPHCKAQGYLRIKLFAALMSARHTKRLTRHKMSLIQTSLMTL